MIRAILIVMAVAIAAVLSGDYPPSAQASYVIGGTCADGYHKYPSGHSDYCPKVVTQLSTEPSDTSVTVTGMVDSTGGTIYASATLGACGTPLHWQQIQAGAPDEASQSASLSSTSFSLALTGMSDETAYCAQVMAVSSAGFVSVILSQNVTTEATAGPPSGGDAIAGGDDYFAGVGGSGAASGTSDANRWANYPTTDTLPAGSDMWLRNDSVWTKRKMSVSRAGSSGNYNEIGSYYMDSGTARKVVNGVHNKAILRGGLTDACLTAKNCTFYASDYTADGLAGAYDYAIAIAATADYTSVENVRIELVRSGGVGAVGTGNSGPNASLTNILVDGVEVHKSTFNPVTFGNGVSDAVARNMDIDFGGVCFGIGQIVKDATTSTCRSFWPGAVTAVRSSRILMENNETRGFFGETYTGFDRCSYMVIRNNRAANYHSGAYVNGCRDVVVEGNLILGGDKTVGISTVIGSSRYSGFGIGKEASYMYENTNIHVRNNIIIGAQDGLAALVSFGTTGWTTYWDGNTLAAAINYQVRGSNTGLTWELINNVLWNQERSAAEMCINATSGLTADHNAWYSTTPSDADCVHASDVTSAPLLTETDYAVFKEYGFQTYGSISFTGIVDAATPQAGSPLKSAGQALTTTVLDASAYGWGFSEISDYKDSTITQANWQKRLYYDFNNNVRGATPTIGAIE